MNELLVQEIYMQQFYSSIIIKIEHSKKVQTVE